MYRLCVYITLLVVSEVEGQQCPRPCNCDYYALVHTIDCSNQDLTVIPSGIPEWSTHMNFDGNYLKKLELADFETRLYYEEFRFRYNNIESITIKNTSNVSKKSHKCQFVKNLFFRLVTVNLRGNRLKELPKCLLHIWPKVEYLNLNENHISSFKKLQFDKYVSYSNSLREIYLQNNRFSAIKREELYFPKNALRGVAILDISHNFIYSIEPGSLMFLESLNDLNLSHNNLWLLKEFSFVTKGRKLEKLDLSNNEIMMISQNAFAGLPNLKMINLQNNRLTCLQPQAWSTCQIPYSPTAEENVLQFSSILGIEKFTVFLYKTFERNYTSLHDINVEANPWTCDCKLKGLATSPLAIAVLSPSLSNYRCENGNLLQTIIEECP